MLVPPEGLAELVSAKLADLTELQKRVEKLEKTNSILNLLLIILILAIIMIGIQLHFTNNFTNQIFTYFNDLNNGTYEEVMNFRNADGNAVTFSTVPWR